MNTKTWVVALLGVCAASGATLSSTGWAAEPEIPLDEIILNEEGLNPNESGAKEGCGGKVHLDAYVDGFREGLSGEHFLRLFSAKIKLPNPGCALNKITNSKNQACLTHLRSRTAGTSRCCQKGYMAAVGHLHQRLTSKDPRQAHEALCRHDFDIGKDVGKRICSQCMSDCPASVQRTGCFFLGFMTAATQCQDVGITFQRRIKEGAPALFNQLAKTLPLDPAACDPVKAGQGAGKAD